MQLYFPEYVGYLHRLCDEHVTVKSFIMGSSERVLRRAAEDLDYPLVWALIPDIVAIGDGNYRFATTLFFLDNANNEEVDEDKAILAMSYIAMDFHLRMKEDHNLGLITYDNREVVFQPKIRWTGDNDHGFVMECDLVFGSEACYNPAKFGQ